jgi:4-amino-4-deoxy-L-arabinose transferase-like glycosyltransferase
LHEGKRGETLLDKAGFKKFAVETLPLAVILIGVALVAFSLGPYQNYDTHLEFEAASNVVKMGTPYVKSFGAVIDQPPFGFYVESVFFRIFGLSENTGVTLVTLFGLGSVAVVYLLGRELHGKSTGFLAAALFGLNPWQLVLSRSFLIDTECLFFSLLCLLTGIFAIRKSSVKIALISGLIFSAAILTKFYAAFILIPLFLFYVYSRPKKPKLILSQLAAFLIPTPVFAYLWYQTVLERPMLSMFHHMDLIDVIPASTGVVASPFFVTNFLRDYGLGLYVIAAIVFSLVLGFSLRKYFFKTGIVDLICLAATACVLSVNVILGAGLKLNVPYFSAIKYLFQALPFLVLLAASLSAKGFSLFKAAESAAKPKKQLFYLAVLAAVILAAASLMSSMYNTNALSTRDYLQYRVEPQVDYGYALLNPSPITAASPLMVLQFLGFVVVLSGLLWANKDVLKRVSKRASEYSAPMEQRLKNC